MRGFAISALVVCAACGGHEPEAVVVPAPVASASAAPSASTAPPCDDEYQLAPAPTAPPPDLPAVPTLPTTPRKIGADFTVFGATHALRSRFESADIQKGEISIVGYVVDSNVARAPKCAWHAEGHADPEDCVTEIPSFVLADAKDTKPDDAVTPHIKVLGWARNFAAVFSATAKYKGLTKPPAQLFEDGVWGVKVPFPIPARGQKVRVKGHYAFMFTKSSSGVVADPVNGILTYSSLEVVP